MIRVKAYGHAAHNRETDGEWRRTGLSALLRHHLVPVAFLIVVPNVAYGQQQSTPTMPLPPVTQSLYPSSSPQTSPSPQAGPSPSSQTGASTQAAPPSQVASSPTLSAPVAAPSVSPSPSAAQTTTHVARTNASITLDDAIRLANAQISGLQQARLNERIAAEDLAQARVAFLPKVTSPIDYIYTSPSLGLSPGEPRAPSFIANNAINEYQALINIAGDVDISGRLRATLARNRALLDAARAGTEVARRVLAQATTETYYGLALATAERVSAEQNLSAAEEFETITSLLLSGGG